jgi:hypothetical protein
MNPVRPTVSYLYADPAAAHQPPKRMNLRIKSFEWKDRGYCLIAVGTGELTKESLREAWSAVCEATRGSPGCNILIDLQDTNTAMSGLDLDAVVEELNIPLKENKIVLICRRQNPVYLLAIALRGKLVRLGCIAAVFSDPKAATDWLAAGN